MEKPASLRKALEHAIPDLKDNPDKLRMAIFTGSITGNKHTLSHTEHYTLEVAIIDYVDRVEKLNIVIMDWLQTNEPNLLGPGLTPEDGIGFVVDFVDANLVDIVISLKLSEKVIVQTVDGVTTHKHNLPPKYDPWLTWPALGEHGHE